MFQCYFFSNRTLFAFEFILILLLSVIDLPPVSQILCQPLHYPQTPIYVPLHGPWLLLVEMVEEKLGSTAACVEPGSTTL